MNTQQAQLTTFSFPGHRSNPNSLASTLTRYLYHWPLFLLTLLVLLFLAFAYTRKLRPSYEVKATLLIQDEKKTPDQQSALQELNLASSPKIIENEIEILKSKELISKVVDDLDLSITYTSDDKVKGEDLYHRSPLHFEHLETAPSFQAEEIRVVVRDNKTFLLKMNDGTEKAFPFSKTFRNAFGTWKLSPSQNVMDYVGSTIKISVADPDQTALVYQKKISAGLLNKLATAVNLSIEDTNPERGKDVLNRLIDNYNSAEKEQKNEETQSTIDFIDQRLASLSGELTEAEKGIEGFKSSRGITDLSEDSKISLENMQVNDTKLNEVNIQISVIEGIERYINSNVGTGRIPATLGINDPALSSLIEKLSQLQLQHDKLLATTPETNPDFEPINRGIQSTRAAIRESVSNIKSSLVNTRNKLQGYNSRFENSIRNIPTQERQYISIKRQQASKENLYTYLLQKREEVSVRYASTLSNEHIIDHAYAVPARGLKKMMAFGAAFFLGLGIPAGLIFLRVRFKNRLVNLNEVKEEVKAAVVGQIELTGDKRGIIIDSSNTTAMSEQIRALRTKLYHLYPDKKSGRITLVTSSVSGEGKSFISSNLAMALALSGRKTLLIESDLRKPKITAVFGLQKDKPGISDLLMGSVTEAAAIQTYEPVPTLQILSSGSPVNNPSELLEQEKTAELLSQLRLQFDDIVIDSPPVHLVPDGFSLSQLSDVTLYIVRQGFTDRAELTFIKEIHEEGQLKNMAFVFNGISKVKYGFGYNYDYSYYSQDSGKKPLSFLFSNFSNRFVMD